MALSRRNTLLLVLTVFQIFLSIADAATELSGGLRAMPGSENLSYGDTINKQGNPYQLDQSDKTKRLLVTAKTATITGVSAFCAMAYYLHEKSEYASLYHAAQSQNKRKEYYENQKPLSRNAIIAGIVGTVMLSTGGVLFVMDHHRRHGKNISLSPMIGRENGFLAMVEF
jgi:hypothetical protein